MKLKLICVGKTKFDWINQGILHYLRMLNQFARFEYVEIKEQESIEKEAGKILGKITNEFVVVLDVNGKEYSTEKFAELIKNFNKDVVFVAGNVEGLSKKVIDRADIVISLSKMLFTHDMVRMILLEQIYRAYTIITGKKYHRGS